MASHAQVKARRLVETLKLDLKLIIVVLRNYRKKTLHVMSAIMGYLAFSVTHK